SDSILAPLSARRRSASVKDGTPDAARIRCSTRRLFDNPDYPAIDRPRSVASENFSKLPTLANALNGLSKANREGAATWEEHWSVAGAGSGKSAFTGRHKLHPDARSPTEAIQAARGRRRESHALSTSALLE